MVQEKKKLHQHGTTALLVEQNTQLALEMADRACVLENGRIVFAGDSKAVLQDDHVSREPTSVFRTGAQPIGTLADRLEWTKDRSGIHPISIVQIQEDVTKA
jgi:energy-coupling factor transporter ATP-binding protein EcfA2